MDQLRSASLRNIKYERAIGQSNSPVVGVLIVDNCAQLVSSISGLIPLPMAVTTSLGVLRFFRRPERGELVDVSKRLSADDY